jgi:hypothetical protein
MDFKCLHLSEGRLYFRIAVPSDLRGRMFKSEFRRRIPDLPLREALAVASFLRKSFHSAFRRARTGMLSDEQIRRMADFQLSAWLEADDEGRLEGGERSDAQVQCELELTETLLARAKNAPSAVCVQAAS